MGRADNTNERENYKPPFYLLFIYFILLFFGGGGRVIMLVGYTILAIVEYKLYKDFVTCTKSQEK